MAKQLEKDQKHSKDHAVCFVEALAEELVEVDALRQKRRKKAGTQAPMDPRQKWNDVEAIAERSGASDRKDKDGEKAMQEAETVVGVARDMELVGLAFSGGGIRSATFNLGVLQGLAQYDKLRTFDYLSTVSGGGYIGNWLEAWILRSGKEQENVRKEVQKTATSKESDAVQEKPLPSRTVQPESMARQAGNWLKSRIKCSGQGPDENEQPDPATLEGIDVVEEELRPTRTAREESVSRREREDQKSHTEPPPIRFLRAYSNYLTPRLGVLGADTWTVIAIYLRNLLLNQAVLILFLFALLLLPYLAVLLTHTFCITWMWKWKAPIAVFTLLTWALLAGARNLQGLIGSGPKPARTKASHPPQEQSWVILTIVVPIFAALWILTAWLWGHTGTQGNWDDAQYLYRWPLAGIALLGLPMGIGLLLAAQQLHDDSQQKLDDPTCQMLRWFFQALATGALSGLMMLAAVHEVFRPMSGGDGANCHELCMGVPLTLLVFLLAATIQVGLMGTTFCDPYREWWARVAGWILILTIAWAALFALAFYAPLGLVWLRGWLKAAGGLAWIASTAAGVLGANSEKSSGLESPGVKDKLLSITPYVFIVGLLSLLSLSLELILARFRLASVDGDWHTFLAGSPAVEKTADWALRVSANVASRALTLSGTASTSLNSVPRGSQEYVKAHFALLSHATNGWNGWLIPVCLVVVIGACVILSWRVDLNEFSMNLMYRNRLVRCYLGATNPARAANPFSGLDSSDDVFLSELRSSKSYSGPLPILNGTLNLVSTRNLAWQERKAESFPMTPLRCGYDTWIEQVDLEKNYKHDDEMGKVKDIEKYAYRPTGKYGYEDRGFYVGTAMSISGAAASPNMGYHSVPSLSMLMTFFNVRLGFWAGNPRNDKTWTLPGPSVGLRQLLCELFGLTDDNAKYVYLSDGGHFENLGVYELVKRRCKYIVACDAGADPNYTLENLGNAIRKCREDIGVEIELDTAPVLPKHSCVDGDKDKGCDTIDGNAKKLTSQHCVVGTIRYEMADPNGEPGTFVYIKASLTGDEPADVLNYQTAHQTFPHEPTADQWFSESQFESYRRLGQHVVEALFAAREGADIDKYLLSEVSLQSLRNLPTGELFKELKARWQ